MMRRLTRSSLEELGGFLYCKGLTACAADPRLEPRRSCMVYDSRIDFSWMLVPRGRPFSWLLGPGTTIFEPWALLGCKAGLHFQSLGPSWVQGYVFVPVSVVPGTKMDPKRSIKSPEAGPRPFIFAVVCPLISEHTLYQI